MLTMLHRMHDHMLRLGDRLQPSANMSNLTARFFPAALAQTTLNRFLEPIAAGRLAAVVAVCAPLVFQRLYPRFQCLNDIHQQIKHRQRRFFPLTGRGPHVFTGG
jgi:hypothetical protein